MTHDAAIRFYQCCRAAQQAIPVALWHVVHLIDNLLNPGLLRLDHACHLAELVADNALVDQLAVEDLALVRVGKRIAEDAPRDAVGTDGDVQALLQEACADVSRTRARRLSGGSMSPQTHMIEIVHEDLEPFAFLADEILDRNFDILEIDPCCTSCPL